MSNLRQTENKAKKAEFQDWTFHDFSQQACLVYKALTHFVGRLLFLLILLVVRELKVIHLDTIFVRHCPRGCGPVSWE